MLELVPMLERFKYNFMKKFETILFSASYPLQSLLDSIHRRIFIIHKSN